MVQQQNKTTTAKITVEKDNDLSQDKVFLNKLKEKNNVHDLYEYNVVKVNPSNIKQMLATLNEDGLSGWRIAAEFKDNQDTWFLLERKYIKS